MKHRPSNNHAWESIDDAAKRLARHPGQIRRLCEGWADAGQARRVRGGGRKWHWEIRSDAELAAARPAIEPAADVRLRIGEVTINVQGDCAIGICAGAVSITPARSRASRGDSAAIEGGSTAVRGPYKTGASARRPASA